MWNKHWRHSSSFIAPALGIKVYNNIIVVACYNSYCNVSWYRLLSFLHNFKLHTASTGLELVKICVQSLKLLTPQKWWFQGQIIIWKCLIVYSINSIKYFLTVQLSGKLQRAIVCSHTVTTQSLYILMPVIMLIPMPLHDHHFTFHIIIICLNRTFGFCPHHISQIRLRSKI